VRDLMLVIWAIVATLASIYLCIVVAVFYKRINEFLSTMRASALAVNDIADRVQSEVIDPLGQIGSFLRNINGAVSFFSKFFK
jgi:hypothetical protein